MSTINIRSYNPHYDGTHHLTGVIACYQASFAGPPWNERYRCLKCGSHFGTDDILSTVTDPSCPNNACEGQLVDFWPSGRVRSDFLDETEVCELDNRRPSSWIAVSSDQVVGICWGATFFW